MDIDVITRDVASLKNRVSALEGKAPGERTATLKIETGDDVARLFDDINGILTQIAEHVDALSEKVDAMAPGLGDSAAITDAVKGLDETVQALVVWKDGLAPLLEAVNAEWEKKKSSPHHVIIEEEQPGEQVPQAPPAEEQPAQS